MGWLPTSAVEMLPSLSPFTELEIWQGTRSCNQAQTFSIQVEFRLLHPLASLMTVHNRQNEVFSDAILVEFPVTPQSYWIGFAPLLYFNRSNRC